MANNLLPPKGFAATQLVFDYEFGLIRRGLAGSVLNLFWGETVSRAEIHVAAGAITLTAAGLFFLYLFGVLRGKTEGLLLVVLALSSFAFAGFVGATGYLDGVLLIGFLLALLVGAHHRLGLVLHMGIMALGVFVHENMLPFFAMALGVGVWLGNGCDDPALRAFKASLPVLAGLCALLLLIGLGGLDAGQFGDFLAYLERKTEFTLDPASTVVAGRTLTDNLDLMAQMRASKSYWGWVAYDGLPLLLMSLWLIWLNVQLAQRERFLHLLLVLAILAPLSVNIVAFDVVRFGAISVMTGFVLIALQVKTDPAAREKLAQHLSWPMFVLLVVINLNMAAIHLNSGEGHLHRFPWVLVQQVEWLTPG